jgi:hypothetical protein
VIHVLLPVVLADHEKIPEHPFLSPDVGGEIPTGLRPILGEQRFEYTLMLCGHLVN